MIPPCSELIQAFHRCVSLRQPLPDLQPPRAGLEEPENPRAELPGEGTDRSCLTSGAGLDPSWDFCPASPSAPLWVGQAQIPREPPELREGAGVTGRERSSFGILLWDANEPHNEGGIVCSGTGHGPAAPSYLPISELPRDKRSSPEIRGAPQR